MCKITFYSLPYKTYHFSRCHLADCSCNLVCSIARLTLSHRYMSFGIIACCVFSSQIKKVASIYKFIYMLICLRQFHIFLDIVWDSIKSIQKPRLMFVMLVFPLPGSGFSFFFSLTSSSRLVREIGAKIVHLLVSWDPTAKLWRKVVAF